MEQNPILKLPLSLDSEIPLYSQLMGIIKRKMCIRDSERGLLFLPPAGGVFFAPPPHKRKGRPVRGVPFDRNVMNSSSQKRIRTWASGP